MRSRRLSTGRDNRIGNPARTFSSGASEPHVLAPVALEFQHQNRAHAGEVLWGRMALQAFDARSWPCLSSHAESQFHAGTFRYREVLTSAPTGAAFGRRASDLNC